ncbi:MAG TPA: tetratricopeptide repeat protein [Bacteroidales bacterium]|nr:tetratricopeptide repeat protein [Bacteroidales bacterium]
MSSKKVKQTSNQLKSNKYIYYFVIAVLGFLLYGQSVNNDFNIDDDYVYENHELVQKGIAGIPEIFTSRYNTRDEQYFGYRPLTIAIYAIEYEFFGSNPHTAHFFNIVYYIICCSLLFYFLNILFEKKYPQNYLWISFLIVLIFQTHAIHTEVVLSLKNREEIISLIFGLLATIFSLKYFQSRKILPLILSVIMLSLAFLAKESAVIFVILIPLIIIFFNTDIKLFSKFEINGKNLPKLSDKTTILTILLFIWVILFLVLCPYLNIWKGKEGIKFLYKETDPVLNAFIAWGVFIINYLIVLYCRKKSDKRIKLSTRNLVLWGTSLILLLVIIVGNSYFFGFLSMILLLITLLPDNAKSIVEIKWFENLSKKVVISIVAFVIISGVILFVTYYVPKQSMPETNAPVYKWQNPSFDQGSSLTDKAALAIYSLGYYAKLLIIPHPLRFYYGYSMIPAVGITNPIVLISLVVNLLFLFIAFRGFNKRSLLSFGILFYFIAILPFANTFFPLTGIIAERMLFTPSVGFAIVVTFIIFRILKVSLENSFSKSMRINSIIIVLIIVLPNTLISMNRNGDWKDRKTLFSHDIEYLENSAKANTLYGNLLIGEVYNAIKQNIPLTNYRSQIELAIKHFNQSLLIDSTYSNPWYNLGYINMILYKDYSLAEKQLTKCLEVDSTIAAAYLNRGIANYHLGNYNKSIQDLYDYLNKNHNYKDKELDKAYVFSAKSHFELGDTAMATKYYVLAVENLKMQNLNKAVLDDIKKYFLSVHDYLNAIKVVDIEIGVNPSLDAPFVEKGNYYLLSGDTIKAVENWGIAFDKFNGNFNIGMTLSNYYREIGNFEKADYYYNTAIKFKQNSQN